MRNMSRVYIYCLTLSMLLIRTYFCPVVVNQIFFYKITWCYHYHCWSFIFLPPLQLMTNKRLWLPTFCTLGEGGHHHNQSGDSMTPGFMFNWRLCNLRGRKLWMMRKSSFKNAFLTLTGLLLPFLDPSPPPQAPQVAQNLPVAQDDALPATPPAASDSDHSE